MGIAGSKYYAKGESKTIFLNEKVSMRHNTIYLSKEERVKESKDVFMRVYIANIYLI
jgi:hypothetical protein